MSAMVTAMLANCDQHLQREGCSLQGRRRRERTMARGKRENNRLQTVQKANAYNIMAILM